MAGGKRERKSIRRKGKRGNPTPTRKRRKEEERLPHLKSPLKSSPRRRKKRGGEDKPNVGREGGENKCRRRG